MFWTIYLINLLKQAPWPCDKRELIDYAERTGAPLTLIENLEELDDDTIFNNIDEVVPDRPTEREYYFNEDESDY